VVNHPNIPIIQLPEMVTNRLVREMTDDGTYIYVLSHVELPERGWEVQSNSWAGEMYPPGAPRRLLAPELEMMFYAYASACYLDSVTNQLLTPIKMGPQQLADDDLQAPAWITRDSPSSLPAEICFLKTNREDTNCILRTFAFTNVGGAHIPLKAVLTGFGKSGAPLVEYTFEAERVSGGTSVATFTPELTANTFIQDYRFAGVADDLPIFYPGTNAWPSEAASRAHPNYQLLSASLEEVQRSLRDALRQASPLAAAGDGAQVNPQNQFAGIGAVLTKNEEQLTTVRDVLPDTPASKAGIKAGFIVMSIDGTNAAEKSLAECVSLVRGAPGTIVTLELVDPLLQKTNKVPIKRETITIPARPSEPPAVDLVGKTLPDLTPLGVAPADHPADRPQLAVLVDAEQRPSRRALSLLAEQSAALKQKGIAVVVLQAAIIDDQAFAMWKKDAALPFPIGRFGADADQARLAWGASALPWLILTDRNHRVLAQGFPLEQLDSKLNLLQQP
jgi:hypothetical protein